MALIRVVSRLLQLAQRAKGASVVEEALSVLEHRLELVQPATKRHGAVGVGGLSRHLVYTQGHCKQPGVWKSTFALSVPDFFSVRPLTTAGLASLVRTLKTSPSGASKLSKRSKVAKGNPNRSASGPALAASKTLPQTRSLPQTPTTSAVAGGVTSISPQAVSAGLSEATLNPGVSVEATGKAGGVSGEAVEAPKFQFSGSEEERKGSAVVRVMAVMVLGYIGMNIYPLMGDSLATHAVALTRSKDPFLQRSGASRVAMIATSDKRRRKIVELGGVASLASLARNEAVDDVTLDHVLDALVKVCEGQEGVAALQGADLGPSLERIVECRSEEKSLQNAAVLLERSLNVESQGD